MLIVEDIYIFYGFIAALALLLGALLTRWLPLGPKGESVAQHFSAGVVLAAVAIELLPKIAKSGLFLDVVIGFALGVAVMLLMRVASDRLEQRDREGSAFPFSTITALATDLFIDGMLIGIAFIAGKESGIIVCVALAFEFFSLGMPLTLRFKKRGVSPQLAWFTLVVLALSVPAGTFIGIALLQQLPSAFFLGTLSFGVAALLYLVTEELLLEAHERKDTPAITAAFYLGFLLVLSFA